MKVFRKGHGIRALLVLVLILSVVIMSAPPVGATASGSPATYTLDADFDQGTLVNVNHIISDQLRNGGVGSEWR